MVLIICATPPPAGKRRHLCRLIPLPPHRSSKPVCTAGGFFVCTKPNQACLREDCDKQKINCELASNWV